MHLHNRILAPMGRGASIRAAAGAGVARWARSALTGPRALGTASFGSFKGFGAQSTRQFASLGLPVTDSEAHRQLVERAKAAYGGSAEVDAAMSEMLSKSRLVLFMEGSLDHPKSLCAGNLSRIFTSLQITGLSTVDLLDHPEILGYLCTHLNEPVRTLMFKDGKPLLDYDQMLALFKKGTLLQALQVPRKAAPAGEHKPFKDMLPIANY